MKTRKKIGLECQRLFRANKHGIEIVSWELISALHKIESEFDFIVFAKKDAPSDLPDPSVQISKKAFLRSSYPVWEQFHLPRAAAKEKVDLLHCLCNTAPLFLKTPLLITIHDIIYLESLRNINGSVYQNFGNLYRRWDVPIAKRKALQIITVSEYEKVRIVRMLGIPEEEIRVIYNGISSKFRVLDATSPLLMESRNRYKLPENFFLFLGNKAYKKNTIGVLRAYQEYFHRVPNPLPLVIVDIHDRYILDLMDASNFETKVRESVLTLGYIAHEEIVSIYNLASCFLYPSIREGFGLPILEAMASGTPVITSDTSSMPEIAGGAALLVNPQLSSEIAEAMIEFSVKPDLMKDLRARGLQNIKRFTWDVAANQLIETYEHLMSSAPIHV